MCDIFEVVAIKIIGKLLKKFKRAGPTCPSALKRKPRASAPCTLDHRMHEAITAEAATPTCTCRPYPPPHVRYHRSHAPFSSPRSSLGTASASPHAPPLCRRAQRCPASSTDMDVPVRPRDAFDLSTSSSHRPP
jgi:hypothetical protein